MSTTRPSAETLTQSMVALRAWLKSGRLMPDDRTAWDVCVVLDFLDVIPAERLNSWHKITYTPDRWHMSHPVSCDLTECPFDEEVESWMEGPEYGTYRWHDPNERLIPIEETE